MSVKLLQCGCTDVGADKASCKACKFVAPWKKEFRGEIQKSCTGGSTQKCLAITPKGGRKDMGKLTKAMVDECEHHPDACNEIMQAE